VKIGRNDRTYSRRSLHGQVAHQLGFDIIRGVWKPGQLLPREEKLGSDLHVSRTALREAIKILAAKGLVEPRPKIGTRVCPRRNWNMLDPDVIAWRSDAGPVDRFVRDMLDLRHILEPQAAALAASRATPETLAPLKRAYADMAAAGDNIEASAEPDVRFHLSILAATDNEILESLGEVIATSLETTIKLSSSHPGAFRLALPQHKDVLDAIEGRDSEGAERAMRNLLVDAADNVRAVLNVSPTLVAE